LSATCAGAGERIVRVPTKLMAHARDAARSYGKSDPIDALAVARAALREPQLPAAQLEDRPDRCGCWSTTGTTWWPNAPAPSTGCAGTCTNSTRPGSHRPGRCGGPSTCGRSVIVSPGRMAPWPAWPAAWWNAAASSPSRSPPSTRSSRVLVRPLAPALLELCGCATITAAKIVGETADVRRFRSRHAYARHNGTAPLPVWSGNRVRRRLSRAGNRQLNAAIHRVAITQAHYHRDARAFLERRRAAGDTKAESLRALKRRLSDVIYRALLLDADLNPAPPTALDAA
jgi:transposase